jgi:NAD(P)-dependent dehydrogenase (short-subunit alcohol dehydrogenase family)
MLRRRGLAVSAGLPAETPDAVLFLRALDLEPAAESALALHKEAFLTAKAIAADFARRGGALVSVQDSGGDLGYRGASPDAAWFGGLPGLLKTAAREWPAADLKAIDIDRGGRSPAEQARLILAELFTGGPELEVAYDRAGRRFVAAPVERRLDRVGGLPLGDGDVVVISGGARGVTAAAALALAERRRLRFVLLGRTPVAAEAADLAGAADEVALRQLLIARAQAAGRPPSLPEIRREAARVLANREIARTLDGLRAQGSEVRYLACDVADAAALAAALAAVRRDWGPVAGLLHGAGVIADKAIAEKPEADFEAVFRTKVGGWAALMQAVGGDPLKLVCNFSSISAKLGNAGQSDYAIANEVLNKLAIAYAATHPGCRVKSICWGPWEGGMVDAALKRHFERSGVGLIDLPNGALALIEELSSADGAVEMVLRKGDFLPPATVRMSVLLDGERHGFLADHRITDHPVLPVVLVKEWFGQAARSQRPQARAVEIRELQVQKGVVLQGFPALPGRFDIELVPLEDGAAGFAARLTDAEGQQRYAARILLDDGAPVAVRPPSAAELASLAPAAVYGDRRLFHGPAFQTIRRIGPLDEAGGHAMLATTLDRGWAGTGWATDPAALDGCLQLARLWGLARNGEPSLPGRVGRCRIHRLAGPGQAYFCRMRSRMVDAWKSEHEFELLLDGEPAIELAGVEMFRTKAGAAPAALRA